VDKLIHTLKLIAAALLIVGVSACTQPTGLVNVVMSPTEDRPFKTLRSDAEISLRINEALLSPKYQDLFRDVSSDVYEGVVLITGTLKYAANKKRITKLMRTIKGVKKIINELQITDDHSVSTMASDLWLETNLKVQLLGTKGIRSMNYRWRSVKGAVYLIGTARSQRELNTVLNVIRTTRGVIRVINHAWIRQPKA